jgi:hypothetical protein
MKNKLIALLKTLFASKGFNAKELEGLADLVIAQNTLTDESTDQDLQTAADAAKPTADFVQSVASRQVTDVKKPASVETPAPKPVEEPKPADTPTDMPEWAKTLVTSVTAIGQGLAAINGQTVAKTRRESFIEDMKGTTPEYQARELKRFDRITFKDEDDFNSFREEIKADHAAAVQEASNEQLGGDRPTGGNGKPATGEKEVSPAMKELIAERKAKAEATA